MTGDKPFVIRIVDDEPAIHDAISLILEMTDYDVRHYFSAETFLTQDFLSDPGCVVLDLRMSGMSGLALQRTMKERGIRLPIVFLSGHGDIDTAVSAMEEGAVTFLTKPVRAAKLLEAVEKAVSGDAQPDSLQRRAALEQVARLSDREKEILRQVRAGVSSRATAERLGISIRTVEAHRTSAMHKLYCPNLQALKDFLAVTEI